MEEKWPVRKIADKLTPTKIIVLGYFALVLIGAFVLMLPISSQARQMTSFLDALFTSASATCVTGLVVFDTATYWSLFGQIVLLILIQIGGLGFITMALAFATLSKKRIGLKSRFVMQESIAAPQMGGIIRLTRFVFTTTLIVESLGAVLLSVRFVPIFGFFRGIWYGIFHSITAFCNAGFDLMGGYSGPFSSLTAFVDDPLVNFTIMGLIVFSGLGFFVWEDMWHHRHDTHHFSLQTKVVLLVTVVLVFVPAAMMFLFQGGMLSFRLHPLTQAMAALFQSVTTRTAGFATVNISALSPNSQILMIGLMLVGGSPGSTAGGMKTTTIVVLLLCLRAALRRDGELQCFDRRVDDSVLRNAVTIVTSYMLLIMIGVMVLCQFDKVSVMAAMFETVSAIATVGLTLGITPGLTAISQLVLTFLMFFGRVGCMTLLYAFITNHTRGLSHMPREKIAIG